MLKTRGGDSLDGRAAFRARLKVWLAPLALALAAHSSCLMHNYEFSFINGSRSPVEVQYTFREKGGERPQYLPARQPAENVGNAHSKWRELEPGEFTYERGTVTAVVQPGEALFITRLIFDGYAEESRERFPVERVRMKGAGGVIQYEGGQVRSHFKDLGLERHALTYEDGGEK
jgi:hypothetical protein